MKLLTLNTHSLEEKEMEQKQKIFVEGIQRFLPDVIALQEVNQTIKEREVLNTPSNFIAPQQDISLKEDNHAFKLHQLLSAKKIKYNWTWLPMKVGYSKYDEGIALFSKDPILEVYSFLVSNTDEYSDYRTRYALGIKTRKGFFFSVHLSWWSDEKEPFLKQWIRLKEAIERINIDHLPVFLMGDFNGDAAIEGETYTQIKQDGWLDTYVLANEKDNGVTVAGKIDGWKDHPEQNRRIDQIWIDRNLPVLSSQVIFNDINEPIISDHFGIVVDIEG